MNILVLAAHFPPTTRMPGSPRLFNLCRQLAKNHNITLALFPRSQERGRLLADDPDNKDVFRKIISLPPSSEISSSEPTLWAKQLHRLTLEPFFLLRRLKPKYYAAIRQQVRDILAQSKIDLLYVDGLEMTQYVELPAKLPLAVDFCDCTTVLFSQKAKLEKTLRNKLALFAEAHSIAAFERNAASNAGLAIVISKADEEEIKALSPGVNTLVVPNGVDSCFFAPLPASSDKSAIKLIFTGVMAYGPNADASTYFAREVFPLVKQEHSAAEFWIVGSSPPQTVRSLAEIPGVHVTGTVDDIRPFLGSSDIFVSPLRYGTGLKNKILAALAMKKPVIATPASLLGLEALPDVHLLSATTPAEFAEKINMLLKSPELTQQLADNGRRLVEERYSWTAHAVVLEKALVELAAAHGH
jgi:sugar transferase (PEP-CTERM/EpsH1 system associated)